MSGISPIIFRNALRLVVGSATAAILAVVSLAALAPAAVAGPLQTVAYSAFGPNDSYNGTDGPIVSAVTNQSGMMQSMQFVATDTVFGVNTLDIALRAYNPGTITFELFADSGSTSPAGQALLTFSRSDVGATDIYRFSSAQSVDLFSGTSYWLTATGTNDFSGSVWENDQGIQTERQSTVLYTDGSNSGAFGYQGTQSAFAMSTQTANAAAAPEPGSIALLLTAGVPIVGIIRRRKKR